MLDKIFFVVIGAIIGWALSWVRFGAAENANLIGDHIADLEGFSEELRDYWATSYKSDEEDLQRTTIARLKAQHLSISVFYGITETCLDQDRREIYRAFALRLFKEAMGGEFETIGRAASEEMAIETQSLCSSMIICLRSARREQFGIRAILRSVR